MASTHVQPIFTTPRVSVASPRTDSGVLISIQLVFVAPSRAIRLATPDAFALLVLVTLLGGCAGSPPKTASDEQPDWHGHAATPRSNSKPAPEENPAEAEPAESAQPAPEARAAIDPSDCSNYEGFTKGAVARRGLINQTIGKPPSAWSPEEGREVVAVCGKWQTVRTAAWDIRTFLPSEIYLNPKEQCVSSVMSQMKELCGRTIQLAQAALDARARAGVEAAEAARRAEAEREKRAREAEARKTPAQRREERCREHCDAAYNACSNYGIDCNSGYANCRLCVASREICYAGCAR